MDDDQALERRFMPREMTAEQQYDARMVREMALALARKIIRVVPLGPEHSKAVDLLELATMTAVSGIARR